MHQSFASALRRRVLHLLAFLPALNALAGVDAENPPGQASPPSAIAEWWTGKSASGNWLGARDAAEAHGVTFWGSWKSTFYGITGGGIDAPRGAFDEEIHLGLKLDLEKMLGISGLSANGAVRWRDGENPNAYVGMSPAFNPTAYQVGKQWRMMPFSLLWESRDLLPVPDMITLSGGWQNPYFFFAQQPESKLFLNNAIAQTKGIGANIPFNGSYGAWGGHLKIKPTVWSYAQAGLYLAIPDAVDTANHGLDFQGARPADRNGLYFIGETGVTPAIAGLPGKYAMGGYYWGIENQSFLGAACDAKYGFYWQADQMLFRERSPAAPSVADGKSFKEPVALTEQGLYSFTFLNYAPKSNNALSFYFHTGLVYKGLLPGRDKDQIGIAFALGNYSYDKILAEEDSGNPVHQTNEGVVEIDYRAQLSQFLYVQPFWQYLVRPGGTGLIENANILGVHMGVTF